MRDGDAGDGDGFGGDGSGGGGVGSDGLGAIGGASGAADGANRYRLLDTLREFGADQLAEAGEQARFLDRLTDWCLAMAGRLRQAEPGRRSGRQAQAAARGAREHLDRARARARQQRRRRRTGEGRDQSSGGGGVLAGRPVQAYWRISGQLGEGRRWLDTALRLSPRWSPERAWALGVRGGLATFQGDPDNAITDISESVGLPANSATDWPPPAVTSTSTWR